LYIFSVPRVFKGDYLDLKGDMKWRKVSSLLGDVNLVFADLIYKVNRADGKVCQIQGYWVVASFSQCGLFANL